MARSFLIGQTFERTVPKSAEKNFQRWKQTTSALLFLLPSRGMHIYAIRHFDHSSIIVPCSPLQRNFGCRELVPLRGKLPVLPVSTRLDYVANP